MTEQEIRRMLPEVQRFVESMAAATDAEYEATEVARNKYTERYGDSEEALRQSRAYSGDVLKASARCRRAYADAWDSLKSSSDPFVKWIADHCGSYRSEARVVLTALPSTVEDLDRLAEAEGWCEVWDDLREQAVDAGVMPGAEGATEAGNLPALA
ncbi:hypothetical protein [Streptomyces sp. NPDC088794]|uniref:hypothetical protein n=1 Tax=Streptomyces sp. NPDC088794 TaxID=3365902 RepID=UPI003829F440